MSASFTLKFDGWAPDLQNVAVEVDGQTAAVPCADCLNVYYQDAAFRCLPAPNSFGPALSERALNLFSGYNSIVADNYVYAASADNIWLLQDGSWSQVPVEPSVTVTLTGLVMQFTQGGNSTAASLSINGMGINFKLGSIVTRGGIIYTGTMQAGSNSGGAVNGYVRGSYGALNPTTTWQGVTVSSLTSTSGTTALKLSGTFAQNYFTTLSLPSINKSLPTSSATFTQSGGITQWLWSSSVGFQTGFNYTVRLIS